MNCSSDNLLDMLKWERIEFPMIDRTHFFTCLSTIFVTFALFLIFVAIRWNIHQKTEVNENYGKRKNRSMLCKIVLFVLSLMIIYCSVVTKKQTGLICPHCCTSYTYEEYRIFGKLVLLDRFETRDPPANVIFKRLGNDTYCSHSYQVEGRIRYWGCIIPVREYYYGNITWGLSDDSQFRHPYFITDKMKLRYERDEKGRMYVKVVISDDKEYSSPSQSGLSNQSEPEQNQTPVQETPDTQLEFQENMAPSSDSFENQLKSFDFAEEEESNESSETSDEFETDENKKEDK
ncbi:MAG: hypothetical protein LBQ54_02505 [Planctomycetaceae bacterium]|jgi:hypothetical protein|nr:hypothetical protein [Planctomycetaceae bacterium]